MAAQLLHPLPPPPPCTGARGGEDEEEREGEDTGAGCRRKHRFAVEIRGARFKATSLRASRPPGLRRRCSSWLAAPLQRPPLQGGAQVVT